MCSTYIERAANKFPNDVSKKSKQPAKNNTLEVENGRRIKNWHMCVLCMLRGAVLPLSRCLSHHSLNYFGWWYRKSRNQSSRTCMHASLDFCFIFVIYSRIVPDPLLKRNSYYVHGMGARLSACMPVFWSKPCLTGHLSKHATIASNFFINF